MAKAIYTRIMLSFLTLVASSLVKLWEFRRWQLECRAENDGTIGISFNLTPWHHGELYWKPGYIEVHWR